jgi:hypothetical protein
MSKPPNMASVIESVEVAGANMPTNPDEFARKLGDRDAFLMSINDMQDELSDTSSRKNSDCGKKLQRRIYFGSKEINMRILRTRARSKNTVCISKHFDRKTKRSRKLQMD